MNKTNETGKIYCKDCKWCKEREVEYLVHPFIRWERVCQNPQNISYTSYGNIIYNFSLDYYNKHNNCKLFSRRKKKWYQFLFKTIKKCYIN